MKSSTLVNPIVPSTYWKRPSNLEVPHVASRASKFSLQEAERDGLGLQCQLLLQQVGSCEGRTREVPVAVPGVSAYGFRA